MLTQNEADNLLHRTESHQNNTHFHRLIQKYFVSSILPITFLPGGWLITIKTGKAVAGKGLDTFCVSSLF